ncbi:uncharacterized protein LOC134178328 [Corticium candelabrum]|uniref:uncharacterized protein LOC134178328 n=1 Tax=Corticium candelabrum TaxID=121492 RepID=UPI002E25D8D5|nr:uncharacterized protein LOC134178328 [Corticium candelabrum]
MDEQEGRTLVLAELKNAYPRSVPFRHLLQQLRFESKAALNRLLYKMLEQKDIRRARVSPPMWTLFSTPADGMAKEPLSCATEDQELEGVLSGLPVVEQQLVCELYDMAPKLCRAVDLVKSLGLSNKEEANKHLYALKERGLVQVVNEEQGGNPLWKCNSVKMQGIGTRTFTSEGQDKEQTNSGRSSQNVDRLHMKSEVRRQKKDEFQPYNHRGDPYLHQNIHQSRRKSNGQGFKQIPAGRQQLHQRRQQQQQQQYSERCRQRKHKTFDEQQVCYWKDEKQIENEDGEDLFVNSGSDTRNVQLDGDSLKISVSFKESDSNNYETSSYFPLNASCQEDESEQQREKLKSNCVDVNRKVAIAQSFSETSAVRHTVDRTGSDDVSSSLHRTFSPPSDKTVHTPLSLSSHTISPRSNVDRTGSDDVSSSLRRTFSPPSDKAVHTPLSLSSLTISPRSNATPSPHLSLQQPILPGNESTFAKLSVGLPPQSSVHLTSFSPSNSANGFSHRESLHPQRPSLAQMKALVGPGNVRSPSSLPGLLNRPPTQFGVPTQPSLRMLVTDPKLVANQTAASSAMGQFLPLSTTTICPRSHSVPALHVQQQQLAEICLEHKVEPRYDVAQDSLGKWTAVVQCGKEVYTVSGCNSDTDAKERVATVAVSQLQKRTESQADEAISPDQTQVKPNLVNDVDYKWLLKVQCEDQYKVTPEYSVKRLGGRYSGVVCIGTKQTYATCKPYPTRKQAEIEAAKLALASMQSQGDDGKPEAGISFKNSLQQYCQKLNYPYPVYETKQIDQHSFESTVRFYKAGQSLQSAPSEEHSKGGFLTKKAAEQSAAEEALKLTWKRN